jgi:HD-GYP domain-containing protein (c-di-GMP phosphodiesterase class II)
MQSSFVTLHRRGRRERREDDRGALFEERLPLAVNIIPAVLHHHERWDGTGYPSGLKGKGMPLMAIVISVADSIEAALSNRPHRTALIAEAALAEIRRSAGTHFDPMIVEAFLTAWSIESQQAA